MTGLTDIIFHCISPGMHFRYNGHNIEILSKDGCTLTFCLSTSTLVCSFLFVPQPAATSGERHVSAVNECLVFLLLSNMNPAKSSFKIVV